MAKQKKSTNANLRNSDQIRKTKDDYLATVYEKEKNFKRWKRREHLRSFFGFLMVLALFAGMLAAAYVLYLERGNLSRSTVVQIFVQMLYAFGAGVALCLVFGLIRALIGIACKKAYIRFNTKAEHADIKLDNLKREKIDGVLQNQIVIAVRSVFETLVEYEEMGEDEEEDDDEYDYFDEDECGEPELKTFTGSVDSAIVYIDDTEVGAIDLDSPFSCFRAGEGLHSLKLVLKKSYPGTDQQLVIETPVNSINLRGDYRIVAYTLFSKQMRGNIKYSLKVSEYDDMVYFINEDKPIGDMEKWYKMDEMSHHLWTRACKLHQKIYGKDETDEQRQKKERKLYGDDTVNMEKLSERIQNNYHDVRFPRDSRVQIYATFQNPRDRMGRR